MTNRTAHLNRIRLAALAATLAVAAIVLAACSSAAPSATNTSTPGPSQTTASTAATQSTNPSETVPGTVPSTTPAPPAEKLQIKDTVKGKGATVKVGSTVSVTYTGWLMDGTMFDSSASHGGAPFEFTIPGSVIDGWNQGLIGMKVGGTRVLIIPPSLGYGDQGSPPVIPPNATLKFEIKLLAIK